MSVGSASDFNENEKDPYKQSVQENEIDICAGILKKDVDNILNKFPDVPEIKFPADTSHFDFDPKTINQSIFPANTSVQPDLNPNLISQRPADVSYDNSIGTPSNILALPESTNVLENHPKQKCARTQVKRIKKNAQKYPVLQLCKESCNKRCITNLSSDDRALINSRLWKLSFMEHRQWLTAYINQAGEKSKTSQQKGDGRLLSREYLLPLKEGKNAIVYKSMSLSTLGLKSNGIITKMARAQRL